MRWLTLFVLLLATTAIYSEDEVETGETNETSDGTEEVEEIDNWELDTVPILTSENFEDFIKQNELVVVEFYAPWCGHCKTFAPEYAKVANELESRSSPIKVVKVDATKDSKYTEEYGVRGYPTLKFFRNGSSSEYFGAKVASSIIEWLDKKTGPAAVDIKTVEAAEEFIKSQDVVVIGFFSDFESEDAKTFLSAADSIDDYRFGITSNEDVYEKYETESDSMILFSDEGTVLFEEEMTHKEIQKFVAIHAAPLIIDFNRGFSHVVFSVLQTHVLMFISKKDGHMEKYAQPAREVAKHFRGKVLFVVIDSDVDEHERIMSFFNIKRHEVPTIRLTHFVDDTTKKYKPKDGDDLSPQSIRSFVQDGIDGKLKVALLSEKLPEDWDKAPVKTLVATNFEEVAFDEEKAVFIAFYSPWSDESKEVAPIFDELGERYKDSETVVIAKFDATANEFDPKYPKVDTYPTLKLYTKGDNEVFIYTGKKTLDGFVKFIESSGEDIEVDEVEEEDEYEFEEDEQSQLKVEL